MRADDSPSAPAVAVVSHAFWQRTFQGRLDAVGSTMHLEGESFEFVGIAPRGFHGIEVGRSVDVIIPIAAMARMPSRAALLQPGAIWLRLFARLRQGQSRDSAAAALRAWQLAPAASRPGPGAPGQPLITFPARPLDVVPGAGGISDVRARYGEALLLIFGIALALLLAACANLAALVFARALERRAELDIRRALGASRWALARTRPASSR